MDDFKDLLSGTAMLIAVMLIFTLYRIPPDLAWDPLFSAGFGIIAICLGLSSWSTYYLWQRDPGCISFGWKYPGILAKSLLVLSFVAILLGAVLAFLISPVATEHFGFQASLFGLGALFYFLNKFLARRIMDRIFVW
ncbi:MAG: hypothetical protein AAF441_08460 [Pseudomonadota bacterium]